jgi:tetratricopeptide (TPR) repeat protein
VHSVTKQYYQFIFVFLIAITAINTNAFACKKHRKNKHNFADSIKPKILTNEENIKKIDSLLNINFYDSDYQKCKAYSERAYYKLQINDSLSALDDCNKALLLDSTYYYYPYYLLGTYYGKNNNFQKAIDIANIGIYKCEHGALKLYRIKANNYQALGKYSEALSMYNILIDNSRDDGSNFYNKGIILLTQRKYNTAITYFNNSLTNYKERNNGYDYEANAYNNIAYAYLSEGKYLYKAVENYTKALAIKKNIDSYIGLCLLYHLQHNVEMLDVYFKLALQERPSLKNGIQEINNMITNEGFFYFKESIEQLDTILKQKLNQ